MPNPHRGDTPIEVAGEQYTLCYDLNACAEVMEYLGVDSFEAMGTLDLGDMGLKQILHLIWAGLQRHHPELDLHDVGAIEWDLNEILPDIAEAFERGLVRKDSPAGGGRAEGKARKKKATKRTSPGTGRRRNA